MVWQLCAVLYRRNYFIRSPLCGLARVLWTTDFSAIMRLEVSNDPKPLDIVRFGLDTQELLAIVAKSFFFILRFHDPLMIDPDTILVSSFPLGRNVPMYNSQASTPKLAAMRSVKISAYENSERFYCLKHLLPVQSRLSS